MKIDGKLLRLYERDRNRRMRVLSEEISCTLTLSEGNIAGAGSTAKAEKHYGTKKGWKISCQQMASESNVRKMVDLICGGGSYFIAFIGSNEGNTISVAGNVFLTSLNINGQGKGKVLLQWQATGNGMPTIQIIDEDNA